MLRRGREQRQRERRKRAVRRVVAYQRWLKSGCPLVQFPAIPSRADFRIWSATQDPGRQR